VKFPFERRQERNPFTAAGGPLPFNKGRKYGEASTGRRKKELRAKTLKAPGKQIIHFVFFQSHAPVALFHVPEKP